MVKANILIVDDDLDVLQTAQIILKQEFSRIETLDDPRGIPGKITRNTYDAILLDMNFRKGLNDGREGMYWLDRILEVDKEAVVILITAYAEVDLAVKAIKEGATDFIMKPWKNQKLIATVHAALKLGSSRKKIQQMRDTQSHIQESSDRRFQDFIGESPQIGRVRDLIDKVANTDASVLILGENGTGKELVARAIHRKSHRHNEVFMGVDLGAIPTSLFESELFGHLRGAFTDARENKAGKILAANGGTLFLDEIGNLPPEGQIKMLRTLQNREVTPVGSENSEEVDFRLISATNMPVYDMIQEGTFRQDLLYRINTVEIMLPALRERKEDIPLLARHFIDIFCKKYGKPVMELEKDSLQSLKEYHWPGNIRELQHAIERAIILSENASISMEDLFPRAANLRVSGKEHTLEEHEKQYIQQVLDNNNGHVTNTAKTLGLTRTALYRRLNKYGLQ